MLFLLRDKLFPILVFLQSVLCGCEQKHDRGGFVNVVQRYRVVQTGRMRQPTVQESSGFTRISPDGRTVALLGYGHAYLLEQQIGVAASSTAPSTACPCLPPGRPKRWPSSTTPTSRSATKRAASTASPASPESRHKLQRKALLRSVTRLLQDGPASYYFSPSWLPVRRGVAP